MQLTQIGEPTPQPTTTIAEMFRQLAEREAQELRKARENALKRQRK